MIIIFYTLQQKINLFLSVYQDCYKCSFFFYACLSIYLTLSLSNCLSDWMTIWPSIYLIIRSCLYIYPSILVLLCECINTCYSPSISAGPAVAWRPFPPLQCPYAAAIPKSLGPMQEIHVISMWEKRPTVNTKFNEIIKKNNFHATI